MARRDAVGDPSTHDLVGQLAVTPVADRSTRTAWLLARQGQDLAHLLWAQPRDRTWPWRVGQPLGNADLRQWERIERHPPPTPQADGLHVHRYLLSDIGVAVRHRR